MARTSILTFDVRARERLGNLAQQVRRHARSDEEAAAVMRVLQAVKRNEMTVGDAHAALSHLRRQQQQAA